MSTAEVTMFEKLSPDVQAAKPTRSSVLLFATGLVSAAVLTGFAALVGFYLSVRSDFLALSDGEPWLTETTLPLTQPNFMLLTVGLSAVTVIWATFAIRNDDNANAYIATGLTLVFGLSQIAQTFFLISIMELELASDERAVWIYSVIGAQIALMLLAVIYLSLMGLRTIGGNYSSRDYEGMLSAAFFWIVSCLVFVLVWYAIYITK